MRYQVLTFNAQGTCLAIALISTILKKTAAEQTAKQRHKHKSVLRLNKSTKKKVSSQFQMVLLFPFKVCLICLNKHGENCNMNEGAQFCLRCLGCCLHLKKIILHLHPLKTGTAKKLNQAVPLGFESSEHFLK